MSTIGRCCGSMNGVLSTACRSVSTGETSTTLKVKLLSELARVPKRATPGSAGYELCSAVKTTVPARGKCLVSTDISIQVPSNTYGRIAPRSGLACRNFIDVGAGVIDADYTGTVGVVLFNHSENDFDVNVGDRIAQLVLEVIVTPDTEVVTSFDETARGGSGFGSSGIKSE
mmetsp:Transcript_2358/g.3666  ORF Transcript_2358/g.3666 Transcript_2358/m.3666 type:complete len:172 (-) Transcript_2358:55-570(-)